MNQIIFGFVVICFSWLGVADAVAQTARQRQAPNILLIMADDLGYGDTGFNGNTIIKTPHLDRLAKQGLRFEHFYSGNSVCSPTRATYLTGRFHDRMGIYSANVGTLPAQELTLAKMLKEQGYATGHFGKWHLGTLSKTISSKGPKRQPELNYSPPWERDYDASFVTESAIQLWNPGIGPRAKDNPFYENGVALAPEDPSLVGGASRVVVDRVVPFIRSAVEREQPFLAVVWFHAPHADVVAGPDYLDMYKEHGEAAHYYGCVTEMDEQVGRIHATLEELDVFGETLIFFCSDNGPEGRRPQGRFAGITGGLRGRKRALYEGGVRVPAFVVWPGVVRANESTTRICSTLDYFPTIAGLVGYEMPDPRPLDGEDILPVLQGDNRPRRTPIPFRYASGRSAWIADGYKLVVPQYELYHLERDPTESTDLSADDPDRVARMKSALMEFFSSVENSHAGGDYGDEDFEPTNEWRPLKLQ